MLASMPLAEMFETSTAEYVPSTFAPLGYTAKWHGLGEVWELISDRRIRLLPLAESRLSYHSRYFRVGILKWGFYP